MTVTSEQVLACPVSVDGASATTIRELLVEMLSSLWREQDGFSGKRPFGYSGWWHDFSAALVVAGLVDGTVDEFGYASATSDDEVDKLVADAIKSLALPGNDAVARDAKVCEIINENPTYRHYPGTFLDQRDRIAALYAEGDQA